jgi:type II secretory pathway pseudopilin PulG
MLIDHESPTTERAGSRRVATPRPGADADLKTGSLMSDRRGMTRGFSRRAMPTRPRRGDGDGGYSFPEILVALVLMGTVMVAVMAGMFTAIRASSISDDAADLDAVLGAAADSLNDALFIACPEETTPNAYEQFAQVGADALGWDHSTVRIVDVLYWDPTTAPGDQRWLETNGIGGAQCDSTVWLSSSKTMQKVIVEATTPTGSETRRLEVVMTDIRPKES